MMAGRSAPQPPTSNNNNTNNNNNNINKSCYDNWKTSHAEDEEVALLQHLANLRSSWRRRSRLTFTFIFIFARSHGLEHLESVSSTPSPTPPKT
mmetsp:Transcript_49666/g.106927  ORF Transcript_49666/g.106927 Transcript_49666/m.106927 type:complete len:94 (+) Transcript_49666:319-600(+)